MKHDLELPADLQHLLEKRAETDRRKKQRRATAAPATTGATEQRANADRRKQSRRPPKK